MKMIMNQKNLIWIFLIKMLKMKTLQLKFLNSYFFNNKMKFNN